MYAGSSSHSIAWSLNPRSDTIVSAVFGISGISPRTPMGLFGFALPATTAARAGAVMCTSGGRSGGVASALETMCFSTVLASESGLAIADLSGDGSSALVSTVVIDDWTNVQTRFFSGDYAISGVLAFQVSDPLAGDLDGDGREDIVLRAPGRLAVVLSGRGNRASECSLDLELSPATPSDVAIGDLDGDGRSEIAIINGTSIELRRLSQ